MPHSPRFLTSVGFLAGRVSGQQNGSILVCLCVFLSLCFSAVCLPGMFLVLAMCWPSFLGTAAIDSG